MLWQAPPSAPLNIHALPFVPFAAPADGSVHKVNRSIEYCIINRVLAAMALSRPVFLLIPTVQAKSRVAWILISPHPLRVQLQPSEALTVSNAVLVTSLDPAIAARTDAAQPLKVHIYQLVNPADAPNSAITRL